MEATNSKNRRWKQIEKIRNLPNTNKWSHYPREIYLAN